MVTFDADGRVGSGYLAVPPSGGGPGVLVLHAWWGLNPFFKDFCDRLAEAGFVAFAPDLYDGKVGAAIEEAQALIDARDDAAMTAFARGGLAFLRAHSATRGAAAGAIGFSMGAGWAVMLAAEQSDAVAAVTLFYGCADGDFASARAAFLCHFAESDSWEPLEYVRQMEAALRAAGRDVTVHIYPNVAHWFAETGRPEYNEKAAKLAWQRTLDFLRQHLSKT